MKLFLTPEGYYLAETKTELYEYFTLANKKISKQSVLIVDSLPEGEVARKVSVLKKIIYDLESERKALRKQLEREPTRTFDIGEKVVFGACEDCEVIESYENNKLYLIKHRGSHSVVHWRDLFKIREEPESLFENNRPIYYQNTAISSLLNKYYFFGLNLSPEYQRELVWSDEEKVDLIASIFQNLDIGRFIFLELEFKPNACKYEVFDGKQRISTLIDFIEDRFQYKGFYFSDLSEIDRSVFLDKCVPFATIQKELMTNKEIIDLFVKINSTGKVVDKNFLKKLKESV